MWRRTSSGWRAWWCARHAAPGPRRGSARRRCPATRWSVAQASSSKDKKYLVQLIRQAYLYLAHPPLLTSTSLLPTPHGPPCQSSLHHCHRCRNAISNITKCESKLLLRSVVSSAVMDTELVSSTRNILILGLRSTY